MRKLLLLGIMLIQLSDFVMAASSSQDLAPKYTLGQSKKKKKIHRKKTQSDQHVTQTKHHRKKRSRKRKVAFVESVVPALALESSEAPKIKTRKYIETWLKIERDQYCMIPEADFYTVLHNFEQYKFKRNPETGIFFHRQCKKLRNLLEKLRSASANKAKVAALDQVVEIFLSLWSIRANYVNPQEHKKWIRKMNFWRLFAYADKYEALCEGSD